MLELLLKLTGLGFVEYVRDRMNIFDGIVTVVSVLEIALSGSGSVSVFRTFRLLRLFKLVRYAQ